MKKRKALLLIAAFMIVSTLMTVTVFADTGPKPSVHVSFENMGGEPCYATLLSKTASTGPFYVWDGNEEHIDLSYGFITEDVWRAFVEYDDPDGYFFLQRAVWKVSVSKDLTWGYYPPESFKILLNVLLNIINFRSGQAAFTAGYVMLELAVFAAEAAIYSVFLRRISDKTRPVWVYVIYALVANAASFAAGMGIAHAVPGIF